jgi:hypothetical protein
VIKSQKEKEDTIRKLLNERHPSRYITKNARCSPNVVSRIRKEMACEQLDKKKTLPISAQAFKLFLEKKTLVQVAIILEISAQEVLKIHSEFLLLQNKGKLTEVLDTDQDYQASLLKLNDYLRKNNIDIQHGLNIVDLKEQIKNLRLQNESLELDNFNFKESEKYWKMEYQSLKRKYQPKINLKDAVIE